ncbi:MAG: (d)CMP kinase [Candidatus Omnitrophica bacterium]|nr:(d)CMP kinase [Candidatus Omnitrophota bacterium]MDD5429199.1 (d)CMP kinase [Candidatus Omnitrophota bacterium]
MVIAIDGPAGSGKTTVAKLLAAKLGIFYLDTGATYRALTYLALKEKVSLSDAHALQTLAKGINLSFRDSAVYLDAEDVTAGIRTPQIDKSISQVVSYPQVREVMVKLQRQIAKGKDCIVEGRDITTVVFPNAKLKFYLDADPLVRAKRRYDELKAKGTDIGFEEVKNDLEKRDHSDKNREVGPLIKSKDAIVIDTTPFGISETVEFIAEYIQKEN